MLKRMLIVLSVLLLSANAFAYAEGADKDYERLLNLGIIDSSYENYANKKTISQKDFLESLIRITTEENIEKEAVPEYAKTMGIISTINNAELNSAVTYERALNLSLNLLGYSKIIELSGGDTAAVIQLAGSCKLNSGIVLSAGDSLNGKAFVKLLNNIIEANVVNANMDRGYSVGDENALQYYREVDKITGRVTRIHDTALLFEDGCGDGRIAIDEVIYITDYDYPQELLGQNVYAYVKEEGSRQRVYYVEPVSSSVNRIEIADEDILSVASDYSQISYEKGNSSKTLKLNPALTVIYNGQNYTGYTAADLVPNCGKLVCIDWDNDNKYDIVYVYSYDTMIVKSVSEACRTITNVYSVPAGIKNLDLSDESNDIRIYSDGTKVNFSSILPNNVLSIAQSKGQNRIVTIYVSKETVSGELGSVDNNDRKITVGEDEYKVNDAYYNAVAAGDAIDDMTVGCVYTYYFDTFGNVAFLKRDGKDGFEYVYMLTQQWRPRESTARARVLNTDGEWESLLFADRLKLNTQNRQSALTVFNDLGGETAEPQLIMIKRDSEGRIKAIKTASVSSTYKPNDFTVVSATEVSRTYRSQSQSLNSRHYVKYDAAIFLRPKNDSDKYDEDMYYVSSAGFFRSDSSYTYLAYNIDEFGFPDAFVVRGSVGTDATIFVNKTYTVLNSDGDAARAVEGNVAGLEKITVLVSPKVTAPINKGDIIEVALKNAVINSIDSTFTLADATSATRGYAHPADSSAVHANGVEFRGYVLDIDVGRRMLMLDCGTEKMPVYVRPDADVNIYNDETQKYELRMFSDIAVGRYVIMRSNGSNIYWVGVYR